jgi:hypothetical protein
MPRTRRSTPAADPPAPAELAVAIETFAWKTQIVHRGRRYRADDPVVQAAPRYFRPDGLTDSEYHDAWVSVQPRPENTAQNPKPRRLTDADYMVAIVNRRERHDKAFIQVAVGDRYPRSSPLVHIRPEWFRPLVDDNK